MKRTMLLAVLMLGLAAVALAQPPQGAVFQGATENVTLVIASGHTELTGDVYMTIQAGSNPSLAGTITLKYNVPFTSPLDGSTGTPVVTGTGGLAGAMIDELASDAPAGMLVVIVPAGGGAGDYIQVHGVRLDVAGSPKPAYTVTLSSTKNAIFNGQFTAPVIDGAAAGLKLGTMSADDSDVDTVDLNALNPVGGDAAIYLLEGFNNAFGVTNTTDPTQTISQMIKITLSSAPPEGVTITFPATATSDGTATWTRASAAGTLTATTRAIDFESTDLTVYYRLTSDNDPTLPETFMLEGIAVAVASDTPLPIPSGLISYTATLAPVQPAFNADGTVTDLDIPRYAEALLQGGAIVTITGSQTVLLAPLAQNMPSIGYDTGVSVANTTMDPGAAVLGFKGAIPQAGKIAFRMYQQQTPSAAVKVYTYITDGASPGTGLDAEGMLQPGSTYTVLVSQILDAAGITEEFQGYMVIITNFTNAHGLYVASNFQTFSQGSPLMVVRPNRQDVPESLGQ
jgi:hypothetical protein